MEERPVVDVDGRAIEYKWVAGETSLPTIVFLHEGLGSIDLWRGFDDEVRERAGSPPTLVYNRHGHGWSAPARLPRSATYMHDEADAVLPQLIAALGIDRPVLVGHSDGASIALLHAGGGRDVSGLALIAPHVFVEPESIAGIEQARDLFDDSDMATKMARYHADPEATFRGWNDIWLSPAFRAWNIEHRLPQIEVPVLVVQGTGDQYGTTAQVDAIEAGLGGTCRSLVIEGAGHAPHLEHRDSVASAIAEFVLTLPFSASA